MNYGKEVQKDMSPDFPAKSPLCNGTCARYNLRHNKNLDSSSNIGRAQQQLTPVTVLKSVAAT
jgi:hypothetical protein